MRIPANGTRLLWAIALPAFAFLCPAIVWSGEGAPPEGGPPPDPAAEAAALRDLQTLMERMSADSTEQPREREESLRTLARVREALGSWPESLPFYGKLLDAQPGGPVCQLALSGALRARAARDGHMGGIHLFLDLESIEAARKSGEVAHHLNRLKNQFKQVREFFRKSSERLGPGIRPLPGVTAAKGEPQEIWRIPAPAWAAAAGTRAPKIISITPVIPDMKKRIALLPESKP